MIESSNQETLQNYTEHYDEIQTIKNLDMPLDHYGKTSFLEVINLAVDIYQVHKTSYELSDYLLATIDFFTKEMSCIETSEDYKKYLKKTRRLVKHEVR